MPDKAVRCPGCGQPIQSSSRALRLFIGLAGLIVLMVVMALIYHTVGIENGGEAEASIEKLQKTPEEELFPPVAPDNGSKESPKPEKKPPLNEK